MFDDFYTALCRESIGIPEKLISEEKCRKLFCHIENLLEKGRQFNLTAIKDPDGARQKHVLDCLYCAREIDALAGKEEFTLLDIGSGGGFPALPIAVTLDNARVTALDSTARKCTFIAETAEKCGVTLVTVPLRAEDAAKDMRENFDFVSARAVARLNVLSELAAPFVKIGGYFVSMKGSMADEETTEAKKACEKLGLSFIKSVPYEIENGGVRHIVIYKKAFSTPSEYPRNYSQIKKKPL